MFHNLKDLILNMIRKSKGQFGNNNLFLKCYLYLHIVTKISQIIYINPSLWNIEATKAKKKI